ncbi:Pycsar system effector family protein [Curtobacterium sp. MCLR17_044]|uniref:Pycsar system effector family protein n=1 Tax=Curtobacterium sp. MCLR17_044 TaxID=2175628 RepID=UPI0011B6A1F1|nr:Pycsar system effector family protein [Curtobacterium sp. MCLR17_044]
MSRLRFPRRPLRAASDQTTPNPDHAWKLLTLVNEWIRHSDTKAAVTLAFTGAMATLLFNLVRVIEQRSTFIDVIVVVACALLIITAALCGLTLAPRINDKDADPESINRLFYASIADNYSGKRPEYANVLHTLTASPSELVKDLADQVHANARIATSKARVVKWAIRFGFGAGLMIGLVAITIGTVAG